MYRGLYACNLCADTRSTEGQPLPDIIGLVAVCKKYWSAAALQDSKVHICTKCLEALSLIHEQLNTPLSHEKTNLSQKR